jgi:hypothetical protein
MKSNSVAKFLLGLLIVFPGFCYAENSPSIDKYIYEFESQGVGDVIAVSQWYRKDKESFTFLKALPWLTLFNPFNPFNLGRPINSH